LNYHISSVENVQLAVRKLQFFARSKFLTFLAPTTNSCRQETSRVEHRRRQVSRNWCRVWPITAVGFDRVLYTGATDASSDGEDVMLDRPFDSETAAVDKPSTKKRKKDSQQHQQTSKLSSRLTKALKKTRLSHDSSISPEAPDAD